MSQIHDREAAERLRMKIHYAPPENQLIAFDQLLEVGRRADDFVAAMAHVRLDLCSVEDQQLIRDKLQALMRALRPKHFTRESESK